MTYELVPASSLDGDQTRVLRAIYEAGCPADQRTAWSRLLADGENADDALALLHDDVPVGLALIRAVADTSTVVVRQLLIDGSQRGHELGEVLWRYVTGYATDRGFCRLVWDVAQPDEPPTEPGDREVQLRRIGIYERVGGSLQPIGEYVGSDDGGTWRIPMRLVATSLDGSALAADTRELRRLALDAYAYRHEPAAEAGVRTSSSVDDD
ncbi:GNAT family N-acetyltransferase [Solicola gregarius]|uniref:GNAT family N-acetyltransferase n=1 Tax=Solicola gregarius TaxID=2908642 RepID=A0AA46YKB5_9ACTN|nr:GNAT family N-acetyltransferase [Solicola gregarius]UYM03808.1 GNAT family N-acetyltransferase [Solicola gregarius]